MSTPLRIAYLNRLQAAGVAITPDNEDTEFPASNTILDQRQAVYKSAAAAAAYNIKYDLGSAIACTCAAIFDGNATSAQSYVLEASSSSVFASIDFTAAPSYVNLTAAGSTSHIKNRFAVWYFASQTWRYWRIRPGGAAPVVESVQSWSKSFLGTYYELTKNYVYGIEYTPVDLTEGQMTDNGADNLTRRPTYWTVKFDVPRLSQTDSNAIRTIVDTVGLFQPCVLGFDLDNDAARRTLYGRFITPVTFQHVRGNLFNHGTTFREMI